jgi:predicted outer membrane repeat protein
VETLEDRSLPSTLTVLNSADSGPGSLRDTIAVAQSGDTINFAPVAVNNPIVLTTGELVIDKSLNIEGPGGNNGQPLIRGNSSSRVFDVVNSGATVVLTNLLIDKGLADHGGSILNQGANLSLLNCDVSGKAGGGAGGRGGCIDSIGGTLTIANSRLIGGVSVPDGVTGNALGGDVSIESGIASISNTSLEGLAFTYFAASDSKALGGVLYLAGGSLTATNCSFSESEGFGVVSGHAYGAGGAIYQAAGSVLVNDCSFTGVPLDGDFSTNPGAGGAICSASGDLSINNSTFTGDGSFLGGGVGAPPNGGAIYKASGNLSLSNTVFQDCGGLNGGAVYLAGGTAMIANCDFLSNVAFYNGGAIYVAGGTLALSNCRFADNGFADIDGVTQVGSAIDIVGGSVCISQNTFTGKFALSDAEVIGIFTLC